MSFAGSRYLQGVEKFETDALGIPNIYFTFGRRTSDTTPENNESPIISGCFDISNVLICLKYNAINDIDTLCITSITFTVEYMTVSAAEVAECHLINIADTCGNNSLLCCVDARQCIIKNNLNNNQYL